MNSSQLKAIVQDRLTAVDALIEAQLTNSIDLIQQLSQHLIHSGGKRLRPLLVLLIAQAYGYSGEHDIDLAAVIELVHAATLLHDDIVDNSMLRRGQQTANAIWDNAASVLVGDFLYSRAFQLMVKAKQLDVLQMLADATNRIAEGEVLQLLNRHNPDIDQAAYIEVLRYKTGTLFAAASQIGALLCHRSTAEVQAMQQLGEALGIAFQLVDDALDYCADADTLGKSLGDDLAEGKATLPLIYALKHADAETQQLLSTALLEGDRSALPLIIPAIQNCGALAYTQQCAEHYADQAKQLLLDHLPESTYRNALLDFIDNAIKRAY
jgi:octaprenyl-diphosphate synthase